MKIGWKAAPASNYVSALRRRVRLGLLGWRRVSRLSRMFGSWLWGGQPIGSRRGLEKRRLRRQRRLNHRLPCLTVPPPVPIVRSSAHQLRDRGRRQCQRAPGRQRNLDHLVALRRINDEIDEQWQQAEEETDNRPHDLEFLLLEHRGADRGAVGHNKALRYVGGDRRLHLVVGVNAHRGYARRLVPLPLGCCTHHTPTPPECPAEIRGSRPPPGETASAASRRSPVGASQA